MSQKKRNYMQTPLFFFFLNICCFGNMRRVFFSTVRDESLCPNLHLETVDLSKQRLSCENS